MPINFLKHTFKHFLTLILLITIVAPFSVQKAFANTPLKITDLKFDNSDNVVLIMSQGEIKHPSAIPIPKTENQENASEETKIDTTPYNEITKGFLREPSRAYVDITNAVLQGASKNYELKNSILKNVKISQFSLNPNIVRIVFTYNSEDAPFENFNVLSNNKMIAIRYTKSLNKTAKDGIVYSNTPDKERITFFENTQASIVENVTTPLSPSDNNTIKLDEIFEKNNEKMIAKKEYKLQSKFHINSISENPIGIMIKGSGFLSLKPAFYLDNPTRMVVDFDDSTLANNLKNKAFPIGGSGETPVSALNRETLRLGQNSTNVTRVVIQGPEAKNYRLVISPDLQNVFISKKTNIINSKITEEESILKSLTVSSLELKEQKPQKTTPDSEDSKTSKKSFKTVTKILEFDFTSPVAFSTFEENKIFYIDFNNVPNISDGILNELKKHYETASVVKIALDKTRLMIPYNEDVLNIQLKASPDARNISAVFKHKKEEPVKEAVISKAKDKEMSISNLYKVVIDAGHGGSDVGANRNGIYEKNITLAIAKLVEKNLNNKNVKTTMTLEKDKTVSLQERCDISNETKPDLFVSIHVNSSVNNAIYGVETHWWKEDSKVYANTVHAHLAKNFEKWKTKDRGLFRSQFYVINHTEAPAILVEIGFISNENEREAIVTQKRQTEIAKAISEGIMDYLKNKNKKGQDKK